MHLVSMKHAMYSKNKVVNEYSWLSMGEVWLPKCQRKSYA